MQFMCNMINNSGSSHQLSYIKPLNLHCLSGSNIQEKRQRFLGFLLFVQNRPGRNDILKGNIVGVSILKVTFKFLKVFSEYFKELEEESIRDNFVIIYELMDELMDFGYPQTTDSKILQE